MNLFDILLLLIILACFGGGLRSGLIKQFFSLTAIIGGVALGFFFYGPLGAFLLEKNIIAEPRIAEILGFVVVACLAYMLIHYLSHLLTDLLEKIRMGWFNHLLGGAIGFIIGFLLCYITVMGVSQLVDEDAPFVKNSILAPRIISAYDVIREQSPDDLDNRLEKLLELREGKRKTDFE